NMPPDSGMAFVLVQHLSPDHKSMLADLIGLAVATLNREEAKLLRLLGHRSLGSAKVRDYFASL
ncbi:MAG: hypothetical protein WBX95_03280, partial [Xanthobacteraceae bacterium]